MNSQKSLRYGIIIGTAFAASLSARADFLLNQINPGGDLALSDANLTGDAVFGATQIFSAFPTFSSVVVDDFSITTGQTLTKAYLAFQGNAAVFNSSNVAGWRFSVWSSVIDGENAGTSLDQNTAATTFVPYLSSTVTSIGTDHYLVELNLTGANLTLDAGSYFAGIAIDSDFNSAGQIFGLNYVGGGGSNGYFFNPGNGFGRGQSGLTTTNYALAIEGSATAVPEPSSSGLLAAGAVLSLAGLRRRRRAARIG